MILTDYIVWFILIVVIIMIIFYYRHCKYYNKELEDIKKDLGFQLEIIKNQENRFSINKHVRTQEVYSTPEQSIKSDSITTDSSIINEHQHVDLQYSNDNIPSLNSVSNTSDDVVIIDFENELSEELKELETIEVKEDEVKEVKEDKVKENSSDTGSRIISNKVYESGMIIEEIEDISMNKKLITTEIKSDEID